MTSSNGNIFRVTGPLCGEFTGPGEFPAQRPVTRSFDVFFYLRLNKRLSKQPWGWWFETSSWSLWRHGNAWMSVSLFKKQQDILQQYITKHQSCETENHHILVAWKFNKRLSRMAEIWKYNKNNLIYNEITYRGCLTAWALRSTLHCTW